MYEHKDLRSVNGFVVISISTSKMLNLNLRIMEAVNLLIKYYITEVLLILVTGIFISTSHIDNNIIDISCHILGQLGLKNVFKA